MTDNLKTRIPGVLYPWLSITLGHFQRVEYEAAFADRSADGVARAAHKLKSSARSVGANELADLCQILETVGNAEAWDEIDASAPRLAGVWQEVTDYIKAL